MAKLTKVTELATTLKMDGQQLLEQINGLGLGFTVKTKSSGLTEEQVEKVKHALTAKRENRSTTAIDAKSQSTAAKTTVRIRRRKDEHNDDDSKDSTPAPSARVRKPSDKTAARPAAAQTEKKPVVAKVPETLASAPSVAVETNQETVKQEMAPTTDVPQNITEKQDETVAAQAPATEKAAEDKTNIEQTTSADEKTVTETKTETDQTDKKTKTDLSQQSSQAKKGNDKDKKNAKKAEKDRRKNEVIFDLSPKFEKSEKYSTIELGSSGFSDQMPEGYGVTDADDADEEERRADERKSSNAKSKANRHQNSVNSETLDMDDEDDAAPIQHKKTSRPSNITGTIDPALIRAMLVKDNKKFGGNNSEKGGNNKKSGNNGGNGARTVVNSSQFYKGQTPKPATTSATNFKKVKRPNTKQTPAERAAAHPQASEHKRVIKVAENISVGNLANALGVKSNEVIRFLMKELGMMVTVNQTVDVETAELVAAEYGFTVQDVSFNEESFTSSQADNPDELELRAPIVTVMGHVDHGKTSLLDAIRQSRVTATEAGGITQHIGASTIETPSGKVVFLDTPGHEAFTALRARGAKVTDLVVLVVAADDGVMPQTIEAINHAKAAGVPIIVAINKIDKPGANPERVKQALTEYGLIPEEWGGTTLFKEVSAKKGEGISELLELIQLQSEVLELKANPDKPAHGFILEAYKDNRRGTVASILVQEGTLHINDILVSGACYGKVKSMINDHGKSIKLAEPSTPVEITGLSDVPEAGEPFFVAKDEKVAKEFTTQIKERKRNAELSSRKFDPWAQFKDNKVLNIIIKADVQGSLEALTKSLGALSTEDVELNIVHSAVGGASENDVQLAIASNAIIVGFNTRPDARAADFAKREGVIIESFSIIYDIIDYVKDAMSGLLDPILGENVIGHAEIRNTFNVPKVGTIAGGYVTDGIIKRGAKCRLLRNGKIIYDSKIASLKRFKDDAKEVRTGFECGFSIENYNDVKVGDVVELYEITETKQSL